MSDPMAPQEVADLIVSAILHDLTDRKGLRHAWDDIDEEIQDEIKAEWIDLTVGVMGLTARRT